MVCLSLFFKKLIFVCVVELFCLTFTCLHQVKPHLGIFKVEWLELCNLRDSRSSNTIAESGFWYHCEEKVHINISYFQNWLSYVILKLDYENAIYENYVYLISAERIMEARVHMRLNNADREQLFDLGLILPRYWL